MLQSKQSPPIIESFEDFGYMQYMPNNVLVPGWPGQKFIFALSGAKFNALSTLLLSICKVLNFFIGKSCLNHNLSNTIYEIWAYFAMED